MIPLFPLRGTGAVRGSSWGQQACHLLVCTPCAYPTAHPRKQVEGVVKHGQAHQH